MGTSLAALGKALSLLINLPQIQEGEGQYIEVIEAISDGAKLLCDNHHNQSSTRQHVIATNLDKSLKTVIENTVLDGWLFGEDLPDRIKNAKQIEKSGEELKNKPSTSKKGPISKNFKNPPRNSVLGGSHHYIKKKIFNRQAQPQRRSRQEYHYHQRKESRKSQYNRY